MTPHLGIIFEKRAGQQSTKQKQLYNIQCTDVPTTLVYNLLFVRLFWLFPSSEKPAESLNWYAGLGTELITYTNDLADSLSSTYRLFADYLNVYRSLNDLVVVKEK